MWKSIPSPHPTDYLTADLYSITSIKYTSGSFEFAQWIGYVGPLPIILAVAFFGHHAPNHVIINDAVAILGAVNQRMCAHFVHQPRRPARESIDFIHRLIRENLVLRSRIGEVTADVLTDLGPVVMGQPALHVDPPADRSVCLQM